MATYKTPGVYVEEIVKFPPSVAQVETAIPAFIGYTEKATNKLKGDLKEIPTRITSMLEYETYFGFAKPETSINVEINDIDVNGEKERTIIVGQPSSKQPFLMYYSLQLYFANGGGPCYIISVGRYGAELDSNDTPINAISDSKQFKKGLDLLRKVDEPTLIVFPDATALTDNTEFYSLYNLALTQCMELQDRFTIIDPRAYDDTVPTDPNIAALRAGISSIKNELKYGAAYYPFLKTILDYNFNPADVKIKHFDTVNPAASKVITKNIKAFGVKLNTSLTNLIDKTGTNLSGKLAAIYTYLYNNNLNVANEGFNFAKKGATPAEKQQDFSAPRPSNLQNLLDAIIKDISDTVALRTGIAAEAKIAVLALADDAPISNINNINSALAAFETEIDNLKAIETKLIELSKNLKDAIFDGTASKIKGVITHATKDNIVSELGKLITVTDNDTPSPVAKTTTTILDAISTTWVALNNTIIDLDFGTNTDLGVAENINLDTNNGAMHGRTLASIELSDNATYNKIIAEIRSLPLELPPSSAMAGIYAKVDNDRGVWKAPANVSLNYVIEPTIQVTHDDQKSLNVDTDAGKSINAIRTFVGKGNLVWGARTLAGNDNEWRYISVRRFFNMAEESIKKATEQFVFEPNDKNTWVRVKAMIDNFLTAQWRAGALAGPAPDKAFYVNIGLGETMTAVDVLEGNMIIEIGMAVVRPAEFIILKFSHKMQEA